MVSLRTVLLWVAAAVLGLIVVFSPFVLVGWLDRPGGLVFAFWAGSIVALALTGLALHRSIREDRARLPAYENRLLSGWKPLALLASAVFFGMIAVNGGIGIVQSLPETCTGTSSGDLQCETDLTLANAVLYVIFFVVVVVGPLLIAASSTAALIRDALAKRTLQHHRRSW